ncbi:MAG: pentapeptide repeat-containing protein [Calothrix sp. C42_A2020_038]|nr:pentapeptide repeat-containing protein [Calothrix sp. C42_A2020_038]
MTTPIVRRGTNQPKPSQSSPKASMSLTSRRLFAWASEVALVVLSGMIPYGIGAFANTRNEFSRVPLNPVLGVIEREVSRPLALPVSYGNRNVSLPTNILWIIAAIAPLTLSCWQLFLLAKTGSTIPKRWFAVRVVSEQGTPPGLAAVLVREGVGRWGVPMSVAYILWRYSPAFPNLVILTGLAAVALIGEATGFSSKRNRRAFHDSIAGTYTIDATKPFMPPSARQPKEQWNEVDEEAAIASVVMSPETIRQSGLWRWMQQNPSITLFGIALLSMTVVLGTLVGTQIYIQSQENSRSTEEGNRKQFIELEKRLKANSNATVEERQRTIMAMGTLNYPQSTKFLVDLLVEETNPILLNTIQQALVNVGPNAIPDLKRKNLLLASQLDSSTSSGNDQLKKQQNLQVNQQAINKILATYGGQLLNVDLSRSRLSQTVSSPTAFFNLVLDKVDLWGVNFRGANLNQASFKGSRFRGPGPDGRWDTYDDWVADLRFASMKQANLSEANLSRVLLNKSDLSGATLNKANLSSARLIATNLSSAQLVGADLRGAILENASLTGADIGEAKLNDAELYGAQLGRSIAIGAQLSHANLSKTNWQAADLSGAYLDHANLSNANLSATRLTNVILRSANLENANLRNADLSLADLQGANVAGADFQGVILSGSGQDPSEQFVQKPQIGVQSALIKGVDFSQTKNLDAKQLAYICTQGGIHPRCP